MRHGHDMFFRVRTLPPPQCFARCSPQPRSLALPPAAPRTLRSAPPAGSPASRAGPDQRRRPTRRHPTRAQIRAAVKRAKRSRALWATVNICNTRHHPHALGIRGQMPALGFRARLFDADRRRLLGRPRSGSSPTRRAEQGRGSGRHQQRSAPGRLWFSFAPPAVLSGKVTFEWTVGRRVVGRATRAHRPRHQGRRLRRSPRLQRRDLPDPPLVVSRTDAF